MWFAVLLTALVILSFVVKAISNTPKTVSWEQIPLEPDAKIIDIKTERVRNEFETTVWFSDQFRYITRDHDTSAGFGVITKSINGDVASRIALDAIKAHQEAYEKQINQK